MESLTPLQQRAQQLREELKRVEKDKQKREFDKLAGEARELINKFSTSFSTLYSLLISSNIGVGAEASSVNPLILLSYQDKKMSISFDRNSGGINSWSLFDKSFKSTLPSRQLGVVANREDEDRLIIAIEEVLFSPTTSRKEAAEK